MKKLIMLSLVIILVLIIGAAPVLADSEGAVKQPVSSVGWVVINSTANGMLKVEAHLQNAIESTDLAGGLWRTDTWEYLGEGRMTTNAQGNANVSFKCQLPEDLVDSSYISVCYCVYTLNPTTLIYYTYLNVPIK